MDELEFECGKNVAGEVGDMIVRAIKEAGKLLSLNVELDGEKAVGKNWAEVH